MTTRRQSFSEAQLDWNSCIFPQKLKEKFLKTPETRHFVIPLAYSIGDVDTTERINVFESNLTSELVWDIEELTDDPDFPENAIVVIAVESPYFYDFLEVVKGTNIYELWTVREVSPVPELILPKDMFEIPDIMFEENDGVPQVKIVSYVDVSHPILELEDNATPQRKNKNHKVKIDTEIKDEFTSQSQN